MDQRRGPDAQAVGAHSLPKPSSHYPSLKRAPLNGGARFVPRSRHSSKDQGFFGSQFDNNDADRTVISSAVIESSGEGRRHQ